MSATKAPHAYKTFFIASLPSSSELEYYGFYGPNSVTLQQQSGRNIRFLGAMLNGPPVEKAVQPVAQGWANHMLKRGRQYSSASMIVITRLVTDGSAGSGEW